MQTNAQQELFAFKSIFEGLTDAVICHDLDFMITNWNPAAERLFGYTRKEMIGTSIFSIMDESYFSEMENTMEDILHKKSVGQLYTTRKTTGGMKFPASVTLSPVSDNADNIIGICQIIRDVSQEKLADEKQATLAAIIESSDDAIISKTLEGIITTWNKGAENIFGYHETEAIGRHISLLIPKDRLAEEDTIITNIRNGKKVEHFQTIRLHKDGTPLQISLTVSPVKSKDGTIIGASKVARDITAQHRSEIALANKAQQLQILNSIGKSISEQLNVNVILQKVTDATTELTGAAFGAFFYNKINEQGEAYQLFTLSGAPREAFEKFGMPRNTAVFHATFSGETVVRVDDITKDPRYGHMPPHFGMPKGHLPVVSYLAVPVVSTSGEVIGGLFFGHSKPGVFLEEHEAMVVNVASQAAVALDNSKLFEEVSELSRKKDEFMALAAHELKTPLTSMNGFLQLLQQAVKEDIAKKFADKARRQLEKLNVLVGDLFDISKVEAGKLQFYFQPFDLADLIQEICETFSESVNDHHFHCDLKGPLFINGDKMRMEQVITNLLNNAVKYAPGSPKIDVKAENKGDEVVVSVTDYGAGISKADQAHIFSRFYRIREQGRHISGLGLGLYITREIVERHGGRIWVESEPGKGAEFIFAIPRQQ